jgi:multiple sugar transport system permease protein
MTTANRTTKPLRVRERHNWIAFALLLLLAVAVLFPIYWMLRTSLMSNAAGRKYPPALLPQWLFSNYVNTINSPVFKFWRYLFNTLSIALPSVAGVMITASMAAYAFARMDFKGRNFLFALCIGSMLMPPAVTIIPIFVMWSRGLGVYNSYLPLIVPQFLGGGAFNIFLIRQFMLGIPRDLDEAAMIDGASRPLILVRVLLPVLKPVLITVGLFTFITSWNDVLGPVIYVSDSMRYTISQGLSMFRGGYGTDWARIMSASVLAVLPALILYIVGQKYFVEGIVMTGIKN